MNSLVRCAAIFACLGACSYAQAQPDFPSRPIRLVIGFAPGGPSDIIGRAIALKMPQVIGQQVIVDNRAGANGIVGAELVAKAPPDGYTIYFATTGVLLSPIIVPGVSFNLFRDFEPVTFAATVPMLLAVHPSLPVKNVKELVAFVKALNAPETREYLAAQGADVIAAPPEEFSAFLRQEFEKW